MRRYVGAIDQGTTSTRFIVFDRRGEILSSARLEHRQIYARPGWVEHDPLEIWGNTKRVIDLALREAGIAARDLAAVGVTNQRETTLLWDRRSGRPLYNAIVWQDTRVAGDIAAMARDGGQDRFRDRTGLPLATYFSAPKLKWLLEAIPNARALAEAGDAIFGTMDSWLLWNLSGGVQGGVHVTDVTNASRTQLMSLATLAWDDGLLSEFGVPRECLPRIVSSSEFYADCRLPALSGVPIAGVLGDQQAALVGQTCLRCGDAKNTYGTGCFLLMNTGERAVRSEAGLLTTVAYRFGRDRACYALEGSVAVAGALVQWVRDQLGLIRNSSEIETLAREAEDNGDVYFVPAFSGLFAPHWQSSARGIIAGLTGYAGRAHLARAVLEATAYQTRDVLAAMEQDSGTALTELRVDGGMVSNDLLMQFQADILDVPVVRPRVTETTALGAGYAAGLATGYWANCEDVMANWQPERHWHPSMGAGRRDQLYRAWQKALARSGGWVE